MANEEVKPGEQKPGEQKPGEQKPTILGEQKPGEQKPGEEKPGEKKPELKPGEQPPTEPVAPEKYELKLPDGDVQKHATVEKLTEAAKAMGLTQKQAEKYVEREVARINGDLATMSNFRATELAALKADAELGGAKHNESLVVAERAFKLPAFTKLPEAERNQILSDLQASGRNVSKAWVRFFYNLGLSVKEDQPDHSGKGGGGGDEKTIGDALFPTTAKK